MVNFLRLDTQIAKYDHRTSMLERIVGLFIFTLQGNLITCFLEDNSITTFSRKAIDLFQSYRAALQSGLTIRIGIRCNVQFDGAEERTLNFLQLSTN